MACNVTGDGFSFQCLDYFNILGPAISNIKKGEMHPVRTRATRPAPYKCPFRICADQMAVHPPAHSPDNLRNNHVQLRGEPALHVRSQAHLQRPRLERQPQVRRHNVPHSHGRMLAVLVFVCVALTPQNETIRCLKLSGKNEVTK